MKESSKFIDTILDKISTSNLKFNRYICERFEKVVARMTKANETPEDCIDTIQYLERVKFVEIFELQVNFLFLK